MFPHNHSVCVCACLNLWVILYLFLHCSEIEIQVNFFPNGWPVISALFKLSPYAFITLLFSYVFEPISGFCFIPLVCICFQVRILIDTVKRKKKSRKSTIKIISNRMAWQFKGGRECFYLGWSGRASCKRDIEDEAWMKSNINQREFKGKGMEAGGRKYLCYMPAVKEPILYHFCFLMHACFEYSQEHTEIFLYYSFEAFWGYIYLFYFLFIFSFFKFWYH